MVLVVQKEAYVNGACTCWLHSKRCDKKWCLERHQHIAYWLVQGKGVRREVEGRGQVVFRVTSSID